MKQLAFAVSALVVLGTAMPASAQTAPSREEARLIEFGKEIYKVKANCQYCHKWDASGDQGYGGNALSLRKTSSTRSSSPRSSNAAARAPECPTTTPMPTPTSAATASPARSSARMYPLLGESLSAREIDAVVKYLFAKAVGRGASTYEECVDFWGSETRQCEPMKKK